MEKAMIRSKNWKEWREEDAVFEIDDPLPQKSQKIKNLRSHKILLPPSPKIPTK